MASNINPYNVDGTFPVAGQDNSSQGFRDNFTNIRNNFTFAQAEISDLQSKALVTTALTGQTINNDMAGTQIIRPQLSAWTQSLLDLGVVAASASLDFSLANFQKITTAGPIAINFINWPASIGTAAFGYGVMRVWINVTNVAHTLTLPTSVSIAVNDIAGYNSTTQTITFDVAGNYLFDFSSIDGGNTFQIFDLSRNRSTFRDPGLYYNDTVNSTFLIGYSPLSLPTALALEQGQDKVSVNGSFNSVAAGNLGLANVQYTQADTGPIGGYSVTGVRGNLSTGSLLPVSSGDLLGYFNCLTFTGVTNTGNTFQQSASLGFYATGANVAYGLGGNVAIYTAPDGGSPQRLIQAVGIENDQSAKFYGNVDVVGNFKTEAKITEGGTYITNIATSGGSFVANASVSTVIVNSVASATIAWANITLPSNPTDRQKIKIVSVAPITNANINAPAGAGILYVPTTKFQSGNVSVQLTYISSYSSWYLS